MRKFIITIAAAAFTVMAAFGQNSDHKILFPDIPGYHTLKGDMHIHTVFTDGQTWPTERVDEAILDNLDFICITDHMDNRLQRNVNKGLFNCDRDESVRLAQSYAKGKGLIVIHGGEITCSHMPPGHFNTTFINDCSAIGKIIDAESVEINAMMKGLKEARRQGGFLVWNHPNWSRQAPNETKWFDEHTQIEKAGLMDGIEIFNQFDGYSPEAHHWAVQYNKTLISGTDAHKPMYMWIDYANGQLRPCTLVFAKERSEKGIREALDNRRTAVVAEGMVYGSAEYLKPLVDAILTVTSYKFTDKKITLTVRNDSTVPIILDKAPGSEKYHYTRYMSIGPGMEYAIPVDLVDREATFDTDEIDINFTVRNFHVDANTPLEYSMHFSLKK